MHDFIKAHIDSKNIDLIACVPMDKMSLMKRGFNQASLLSEGLSKALDIPFAKDLLKKTKNTQEQVTLKKHQRFINVKGAFCITEINRVNGKIILLIDDVFTTGATVNECSGVLKKAGAKSVSVLALACGV
jgi:ComF family protein